MLAVRTSPRMASTGGRPGVCAASAASSRAGKTVSSVSERSPAQRISLSPTHSLKHTYDSRWQRDSHQDSRQRVGWAVGCAQLLSPPGGEVKAGPRGKIRLLSDAGPGGSDLALTVAFRPRQRSRAMIFLSHTDESPTGTEEARRRPQGHRRAAPCRRQAQRRRRADRGGGARRRSGVGAGGGGCASGRMRAQPRRHGDVLVRGYRLRAAIHRAGWRDGAVGAGGRRAGRAGPDRSRRAGRRRPRGTGSYRDAVDTGADPLHRGRRSREWQYRRLQRRRQRRP